MAAPVGHDDTAHDRRYGSRAAPVHGRKWTRCGVVIYPSWPEARWVPCLPTVGTPAPVPHVVTHAGQGAINQERSLGTSGSISPASRQILNLE